MNKLVEKRVEKIGPKLVPFRSFYGPFGNFLADGIKYLSNNIVITNKFV